MTNRTRRRLTLCLVLVLITLPAEALLFPVALTPDAGVAATKWASGLSPDALQSAARTIDHYPALYRRAIMGELAPVDRSNVWRDQFSAYLNSHPQLTPEQVAVVRDAIDVASPEAFTPPLSEDMKARIGKIYGRALKVLGPQQAAELFVTLGSKTLQKSNALPLTQRIGDAMRSWRTASADTPDCNCAVAMDTCDVVPDPFLECSEIYTCNFDLHWPMCGPLWSWACTGWCKVIRWPAGIQ